MSEPHIPTDRTRGMVYGMAWGGVPYAKIARVLGINPKTLTKHYEEELECALPEKIVQVAGALFQNAMDGNVTAQIFFLKTRGRWKESDIDTSEAGPEKIEIEVIRPRGETENEK